MGVLAAMKSRWILAGATLALTSAVTVAQTTAKPSPYEGTAQPPATDVIRATETPEATPPTPPASPAPAVQPATPAAPQPAATPKAPVENPDYGIVEGPFDPAPAAASHSPRLQSRPYDPDADIVTRVPHNSNELAEGTAIHTRLDQELSSSENGAGTRFTAQVTGEVTQNGRVIIPAGSVVRGKVMHADYGRRIAGRASLRLIANEVVLPDGTRYSITGLPSQTSRSSNTKVNDEGTILNKDHAKRIAGEYALGAGGGAATGAVLAGPTGAVVGTIIGAGLATTHVLLNRQAAVLPAGSALTFGLTQPMRLTPITNTASR
jgi:hypothetical protein